MTELNWLGLVGYSSAAPIESFRDSKRRSVVRVEVIVKQDSIGMIEPLIWKLSISFALELNYIFVLDQNVSLNVKVIQTGSLNRCWDERVAETGRFLITN